jgi:hypothetical protein
MWFINDPFWERKNSKGIRENGYLFSFLFKKSKNSCGVTFGPKILKFCVGSLLVEYYHEFWFVTLDLVGKENKGK